MISKALLLVNRLSSVPAPARKLFCVIVREAYHGPMHPKPAGMAIPAEILEACGLDVGEFYALLNVLKNHRLIEVSGDYPFEQIYLHPEASVAQAVADNCGKNSVPLEAVLAGLDTSSLA